MPRLETPSPTRVECAQCGSEPSDEHALRGWRHGALILDGHLDAGAAGLVLCPDCTADHHAGDYDEGAGA
jgi:hypothetical protein